MRRNCRVIHGTSILRRRYALWRSRRRRQIVRPTGRRRVMCVRVRIDIHPVIIRHPSRIRCVWWGSRRIVRTWWSRCYWNFWYWRRHFHTDRPRKCVLLLSRRITACFSRAGTAKPPFGYGNTGSRQHFVNCLQAVNSRLRKIPSYLIVRNIRVIRVHRKVKQAKNKLQEFANV